MPASNTRLIVLVLTFWLGFICLGSQLDCAFAMAPDEAKQNDAPPNILFIIADDWGAHNELYGIDWIRTPGFNTIAEQGLLFKNAFTPNAKCAPSRASILTGRYSWQLEQAGNHLAFFPPKFTSWPECLSDNGWQVGFTGKGWGPGIAKDAMGKHRQLTGKPYQSQKCVPVTTGVAPNDYAANFETFLEQLPDDRTPWCFWIGFLEPHRRFEYGSGAAKSNKKLEDIKTIPPYWPDNETVRNDLLDYAFEVEYLDSHIVRILETLDERKLSHNTLVIVTSDHGMAFPRCKGFAYRDSNHVPLAIRWPAGIRNPGRSVEDFVNFVDIAPTILESAQLQKAATASMQSMSGNSWHNLFADDFLGEKDPNRSFTLVCKERNDVGRPHDWGYPIRGIINDKYLYLENREPSRWPSGNPETGYLDTDGSPTKTTLLNLGRLNREDKYWQLNFGLRPPRELFALEQDPHCIQNIADQPDTNNVQSELSRLLEEQLKRYDDPRSYGDTTVFDEYPVTAGGGFYERWMKGERLPANWVEETDFEAEFDLAP